MKKNNSDPWVWGEGGGMARELEYLLNLMEL